MRECRAASGAIVEVEEAGGPGSGWWGPPKGTHGPGKGSDEFRKFSSKETADKWALGVGSLNPDISDDVANALEQYKGETYSDINNDLRESGYSDIWGDDIEAIDSAFEGMGTPGAVTVYRGGSYDAFEDYDDLTGSVIKDQAFVSTSLVEGVAAAHSDGLMIEIRLPEGTPAIFMDVWKVTGWDTESELLLPRDTKFKVISDINNPGDYERSMVVEVIP